MRERGGLGDAYGNNSSYYPNYNYYAPEQNAYNSIENTRNQYMGEWQAASYAPYAGSTLGVGNEFMYSKNFNTWMGKDGKIRSQNWGGNGRTGGKYKFAKSTSRYLKYGGTAFGLYGVYDTQMQYKHNEIDFTHLMLYQTSNAIGFIPTFGTAWSIGWNLGQDFGPSTWYGRNDYKWFE